MSANGRAVIPFYEAVCGWVAGESDEAFGGYFMFFADGVPVAGAMGAHDGAPSAWTTYMEVDDVASACDVVRAAGGMVFVDATAVGDLGTMAVVADGCGCATGLWSIGTFAGFPRDGRLGAPAWFELYTKDDAGSKEFFSTLFGWTYALMSDTDEFRYATVSVGGDQVLGIMDFSAPMHDAMPGYWNLYITVANVDAAAAAATALGGRVLMAPSDTPYGRMASVADPNGAVFSLMQQA
jgi:predicted enzyme related to lactoylglutathione lyase